MKILLSTLLLTAAFGTAAHAANPMMEKADLNKDGVISKSEFVSTANARFAQADANNDGQITKDERKANREVKMRERADAHFGKTDANGDGVISKAEHNAAIDERIAKRKDRHEARKAKREETHGADKKQRKAKRGKMSDADRKHRKPKMNKRNAKKHMGKARMNPDLNKDGVVDRAEHEASVNMQFERMDKNNNGLLEASEFQRKKKGRNRHGAPKR